MECAATQICLLKTPAKHLLNKCVHSELVQPSRLCFSAVLPHSSLPRQDSEREGGNGVGVLTMADTDVAPSTSGDGNRFATNFLQTLNPYSFECSRALPPSTIQQIPPIRLEVIRKRFEDRGLSTEVINLLLVSPRGNTSAAYQSVWNTWYHWNME